MKVFRLVAIFLLCLSARLSGAAELLTTDTFWSYTGESFTGKVANEAFTGQPELTLELKYGNKVLHKTTLTSAQPDFSVSNDAPAGVCRLVLRNGTGTVLQEMEVASLGELPQQPLTGETFGKYEIPCNVMICYVQDDVRMLREFKDMKAKGFDTVSPEVYWEWFQQAPDGPCNFEAIDRISRIAGEAGVTYMFYPAFWRYMPPFVPRSGVQGELVYFDIGDPKAVAMAANFYGSMAKHLAGDELMVAYVLRLHYYIGDVGKTEASRRGFQEFLAKNGYGTRESLVKLYELPEDKIFLPDQTILFPTDQQFGRSLRPSAITLWRLALKYCEAKHLEAMETILQAIRANDPVKPIRLMYAMSYEVENGETSGFQQIGYYQLAQKYRATIHNEASEWPIHLSLNTPLTKNYGVLSSAEGGDVPCRRPAVARLFAHCIKYDPAMVAFCEYNHVGQMSRDDLFGWAKYKPYWRIRKNYRMLYDDFALTSFWKDAWASGNWKDPGSNERGDFFSYYQNHVELNLALLTAGWSADLVNEDLLHQGNTGDKKILFDTNSWYLEDQVCRDIVKFVNDGGIFISNVLTSYNELDGGRKYALQRDYFEFTIPNIDAKNAKGKWKFPVNGRKVRFGTAILPGDRYGFKLTSRANDVVLATWSDGAPAMIARPLGKGWAVVIGFQVLKEDFQANKIFEQLLSAYGVNRRLLTNADESGVAGNDRGDFFVTVLNDQTSPRQIKIELNRLNPNDRYEVTDLLNQTHSEIVVNAKGTLIFSLPTEANACNFAEIIKK